MARHVRDFTYQETIYKRRLQTITVRRQLPREPLWVSMSSLRTLRGAGEIEDVLRSLFDQYDDEQEHFVMVILSPADEIAGFKLLASGTQTSVMVDRRLVFKNALLLGARAIILAHNHPDGSLAPSTPDLLLTKTLVEGGQVLGIEVIDHIIITPDGTCASIKEREPLLFAPVKPDSPVT